MQAAVSLHGHLPGPRGSTAPTSLSRFSVTSMQLRLQPGFPSLTAPVRVAFEHSVLSPCLVNLFLGLLCPLSLCSAVVLWEMCWK